MIDNHATELGEPNPPAEAPRTLLPHQRPALSYCLRTADPALFMDMRLGKSFVTCRALTRRGARRTLILGDYNYLPGWEEELAEEGNPARWFLPPGKQKQGWPAGWEQGAEGWYLCHYAYLLQHPEILRSGWDAVVADESTYISNPKAKTTQLLLRNRGCASSRWILAGAPDAEGHHMLFTQFAFLDGGWMGCTNFWEWRKTYFELQGYDWELQPGAREQIRAEVHRRAFVLTKAQAGMNLPMVRRELIVPLTTEQERIAQRIEDDFDLGGATETKWSAVVHSRILQLTGGFYAGKLIAPGKLDLLVRLLRGELHGQQVVIGFRFNQELAAAWHRLRQEGLGPLTYLQGGLSPEERKRRRLRFQSGAARYLLIQMDSGRFGLNASAADTCVIYSSSPSYLTRTQFEQRILHPTKKAGGLYIDLASSHPVERAMREVLLEGKARSHADLMRRVRDTSQKYRR